MKSKELALCGMLTALALVLLVLSGSLGIGTYIGPILAMLALLPIREEFGRTAGALAYAAAAILGLILVPDRELAFVYLFFGWYPLLQPLLARIPGTAVRCLVKLAVYALTIGLLYGLVLRLLGLTADLMASTRLFNAVLFLVGAFLFLSLDRLLERMCLLWRTRLRQRFLH